MPVQAQPQGVLAVRLLVVQQRQEGLQGLQDATVLAVRLLVRLLGRLEDPMIELAAEARLAVVQVQVQQEQEQEQEQRWGG